MGVVLLLVALPAMVFMAASIAVFDGFAGVAICALVLGVIVTLLRAARGWEGEDVASAGPRT